MVKSSAISALRQNGGDDIMQNGNPHQARITSYSPSISSNPSTNNSPLTTPLPSARTSVASDLDLSQEEEDPLNMSSNSNNLLSPGTILNIPDGVERQSSLDGVLYRETTFTFSSPVPEDSTVSILSIECSV